MIEIYDNQICKKASDVFMELAVFNNFHQRIPYGGMVSQPYYLKRFNNHIIIFN